MSPARSKPSGETTTCPWCSSTVPIEAAICPSCGAQLRETAEGDVLGVTQIDPSAVSRVRRVKPRRLTSCNVVQRLLHAGRKLRIYKVGKVRFEQVVDGERGKSLP